MSHHSGQAKERHGTSFEHLVESHNRASSQKKRQQAQFGRRTPDLKNNHVIRRPTKLGQQRITLFPTGDPCGSHIDLIAQRRVSFTQKNFQLGFPEQTATSINQPRQSATVPGLHNQHPLHARKRDRTKESQQTTHSASPTRMQQIDPGRVRTNHTGTRPDAGPHGSGAGSRRDPTASR